MGNVRVYGVDITESYARCLIRWLTRSGTPAGLEAARQISGASFDTTCQLDASLHKCATQSLARCRLIRPRGQGSDDSTAPSVKITRPDKTPPDA